MGSAYSTDTSDNVVAIPWVEWKMNMLSFIILLNSVQFKTNKFFIWVFFSLIFDSSRLIEIRKHKNTEKGKLLYSSSPTREFDHQFPLY